MIRRLKHSLEHYEQLKVVEDTLKEDHKNTKVVPVLVDPSVGSAIMRLQSRWRVFMITSEHACIHSSLQSFLLRSELAMPPYYKASTHLSYYTRECAQSSRYSLSSLQRLQAQCAALPTSGDIVAVPLKPATKEGQASTASN